MLPGIRFPQDYLPQDLSGGGGANWLFRRRFRSARARSVRRAAGRGRWSRRHAAARGSPTPSDLLWRRRRGIRPTGGGCTLLIPVGSVQKRAYVGEGDIEESAGNKTPATPFPTAFGIGPPPSETSRQPHHLFPRRFLNAATFTVRINRVGFEQVGTDLEPYHVREKEFTHEVRPVGRCRRYSRCCRDSGRRSRGARACRASNDAHVYNPTRRQPRLGSR